MATCRFCGEIELDDARLVKYGVRHYAHHECYLAAGRKLSDLHDWQIVAFPYRVLLKFKVGNEALAASIREEARKNGDGAPRWR